MYQTGHDINLNTLGKSHSALPGGFEKQVCRIFACHPGGGALAPVLLGTGPPGDFSFLGGMKR